MKEKLTPDDKRIIAKKTGYSLSYINGMLLGYRKMQPVVKKAIGTWLKEKEKFINS